MRIDLCLVGSGSFIVTTDLPFKGTIVPAASNPSDLRKFFLSMIKLLGQSSIHGITTMLWQHYINTTKALF